MNNNRYTPVPDSILQAASSEAAGGKAIFAIDPDFEGGGTAGAGAGNASSLNQDIDSRLTKFLNDSTEQGLKSSLKNLTELGQARGQLLSMQLDKAQDGMQTAGLGLGSTLNK